MLGQETRSSQTRRASITVLTRKISEEEDIETVELGEKRYRLLRMSQTPSGSGNSCDGMQRVERSAFVGNVSEFMEADDKANKSPGPKGRHKSTLRAGCNGCTVIMFCKADFLQFVDTHSGVLLSLLGTELIV